MSAEEQQNSLADDIGNLLEAAARETGQDLKGDLDEIRNYAAEQTIKLAAAVGEPGYSHAFIAARDNVLLKAGINAVQRADAIDRRVFDILVTAMTVGAKAIAT